MRWTFFLFQWLGNLTLDAYEERCEFADPAGSFKGLRRFKRNCTNFGSLVEKSNMQLMKWEDFEVSFLSGFHISFIVWNFLVCHLRHQILMWLQDKGVGHWRFSCILSFPWKPILSGMYYALIVFCINIFKPVNSLALFCRQFLLVNHNILTKTCKLFIYLFIFAFFNGYKSWETRFFEHLQTLRVSNQTRRREHVKKKKCYIDLNLCIYHV